MPRPSFPTTVQQFTAFFSSEEAYESYFESCRWPDGFVCIRCVSIDGWRIIRVVPTEHASFVKVRGNPSKHGQLSWLSWSGSRHLLGLDLGDVDPVDKLLGEWGSELARHLRPSKSPEASIHPRIPEELRAVALGRRDNVTRDTRDTIP